MKEPLSGTKKHTVLMSQNIFFRKKKSKIKVISRVKKMKAFKKWARSRFLNNNENRIMNEMLQAFLSLNIS
jgi:hypothetical protein